jgi:hypothetical protein
MLAPHLRRSHIVIMGNVSFHKPQEVKEAIESTGVPPHDNYFYLHTRRIYHRLS